MSSKLCIVLALLIHHLQSSASFLVGSHIGRPHKAIMLSESSQDGASISADANMESTYASLVDRLISRYERQSAANELQNNQLFVGKMISFAAVAECMLYFSCNHSDAYILLHTLLCSSKIYYDTR